MKFFMKVSMALCATFVLFFPETSFSLGKPTFSFAEASVSFSPLEGEYSNKSFFIMIRAEAKQSGFSEEEHGILKKELQQTLERIELPKHGCSDIDGVAFRNYFSHEIIPRYPKVSRVLFLCDLKIRRGHADF